MEIISLQLEALESLYEATPKYVKAQSAISYTENLLTKLRKSVLVIRNNFLQVGTVFKTL